MATANSRNGAMVSRDAPVKRNDGTTWAGSTADSARTLSARAITTRSLRKSVTSAGHRGRRSCSVGTLIVRSPTVILELSNY